MKNLNEWGEKNMIPKSVVELTISILKNNLEKSKKFAIMGRGNQKTSDIIQTMYAKVNIDTYKMLIKEYEKYLKENYSESGCELKYFGNELIEARIKASEDSNNILRTLDESRVPHKPEPPKNQISKY